MYLKVKEVARRLGMCRATIYRLIEEKKLRSTRVLSSIRILESDVAALLAQAAKRRRTRAARPGGAKG
jgi:excisionase family DNA binding protein